MTADGPLCRRNFVVPIRLMTPETRIKAVARDLGFDAAGVARADAAWAAGEGLAAFVAEGRHGDMAWMETTLERRRHPTAMWPEARSAVVVGLSYGPSHNPLVALERRSEGVISVYAQGGDYHDLVKRKLKQLARRVQETTGADVKVFVDTAPLMEKPLAALAGIGWQGKHTNLVSREHGSWLFLGVVLTAAALQPDDPETEHCGSCRACLDVCPTDAFPAPGQLDARRCISYLTIEHKGPIPRELRAKMGNRIYGCDDCLAVCPWNKFAATAREAQLHARIENVGPALGDLAQLDDAAFRGIYAGSPIKRIGRDRFVRNVAVAIGNSGDRSLIPRLRALLDDASPLVRGAAVWALSRLAPREEFLRNRDDRAAFEPDQAVRDEWDAGFSFSTTSTGSPTEVPSL
jgi:epoxyqueuosine reductase